MYQDLCQVWAGLVLGVKRICQHLVVRTTLRQSGLYEQAAASTTQVVACAVRALMVSCACTVVRGLCVLDSPATEMLSSAVVTRNHAQLGIWSCTSLGWGAYTVLEYPYSAACCRTDRPAYIHPLTTYVKPTMTGLSQWEADGASKKATQAGRAGRKSLL